MAIRNHQKSTRNNSAHLLPLCCSLFASLLQVRSLLVVGSADGCSCHSHSHLHCASSKCYHKQRCCLLGILETNSTLKHQPSHARNAFNNPSPSKQRTLYLVAPSPPSPNGFPLANRRSGQENVKRFCSDRHFLVFIVSKPSGGLLHFALGPQEVGLQTHLGFVKTPIWLFTWRADLVEHEEVHLSSPLSRCPGLLRVGRLRHVPWSEGARPRTKRCTPPLTPT